MNAKIILKALKTASPYPGEAIEAALHLRGELTDPLLQILKKASERPRSIASSDSAHIFAAGLLAFWREERALLYFQKFARHHEDLLEALWGDMITEDFKWMFYRTGRNQSHTLKAIAADEKAYEYLRWEALTALNWCVADGSQSREEIRKFYLSLFTDQRNRADEHIMGIILSNWLDLYPQEDLGMIQETFAEGRVDEGVVGEFSDIEEFLQIHTWNSCLSKMKEEMTRLMPDDIHGYFEWLSRENEPVELPFDLKQFLPDHPLAHFLEKIKSTIRLHEARALTLGAVLGLKYVPPSAVISEILQQGNKNEIEFKDQHEASKFYGLFTQLWNELAEWSANRLPPLLDPLPKTVDAELRNQVYGLIVFRRFRELNFFLTSLDEADTSLETIQDGKARAAFAWAEEQLKKLSTLSVKNAQSGPATSESLANETYALLSEQDLAWPTHYKNLSEGLNSQRKMALAMTKSSPTFHELKAGRNDPCPCGSGKKFKKCCLQ